MHEEKTERRPGGIQREAEGDEAKVQAIRKNIKAIREGHTTGGYCETEKLKEEEKKLYGVLSKKVEAAKARHGYSPDPKFKHPDIRALELEINGLSYKPLLVAQEEKEIL